MRNTKWLSKTEIKEILDYTLSDEEIDEAKTHLLTPVFDRDICRFRRHGNSLF